MRITKQQLTEIVRASVRKQLAEGLFGKDKDKEEEEDATVSGQPESSQVRAVEDKLGNVSGLDTLLAKIKTAAQATDLISGVVNKLDSVEQQHLEQSLHRVIRNLKNPDDIATEGIEPGDDGRGYDKAMAEVSKLVNELIQTHAKVGNKEAMEVLESLKKMMSAVSTSAQTQQHLTRASRRRGLPQE